MMQDILEFSLDELKSKLQEWGEPDFHSQQIFSWIYKKGVLDFEKMSDLSSDLRKKLSECFVIRNAKLAKSVVAKDGTSKFLISLYDGNLIEAVVIPVEGRVTGCISSQVGCKYACAFCASGILGFKRNLTCAEMINEVLILKETSKGSLSHAVFMGSGEPLDNYDNVLKAIRIINADYSVHIGARRITISTCGVIPGIRRLAQEGLQVELSVSLHAADEKTRSFLMPVNKKYPLKELIQACKEYIARTNRQVTFEYVLIKGINSSLKDAQNLSKMMKGLELAKVNLIAANPVKELQVEPPDKLESLYFKDSLIKQGIVVTLRKSRGEEISAACGQLRLQHEKR